MNTYTCGSCGAALAKRDQVCDKCARPVGDASLSDSDRARAFFAAWGLVSHTDGPTGLRRGAELQADAMAALAQAFADERAYGANLNHPFFDAKWAALARRAVGVVSDLQRQEGAIAAVLDEYAAIGNAAAKRTAARLEKPRDVPLTFDVGDRVRVAVGLNPRSWGDAGTTFRNGRIVRRAPVGPNGEGRDVEWGISWDDSMAGASYWTSTAALDLVK